MDCPQALAAAVTAAAIAISEGKSADEIALIAAALTQLGDTLTTIAAARVLLPGKPAGTQPPRAI